MSRLREGLGFDPLRFRSSDLAIEAGRSPNAAIGISCHGEGAVPPETRWESLRGAIPYWIGARAIVMIARFPGSRLAACGGNGIAPRLKKISFSLQGQFAVMQRGAHCQLIICARRSIDRDGLMRRPRRSEEPHGLLLVLGLGESLQRHQAAMLSTRLRAQRRHARRTS